MVHHFVLPHKYKKKHRKAHLLSHKALAIYLALFLLLQLSFTTLRSMQPGVLGTSSAISKQDVINLTNVERQKNGLPKLQENNLLNKAAEDKAKNMFTENYWAHNSPSGKSPWVWFRQEGYDYMYAGENLARGFSTSKETIDAWMASKMGHKENLLGSNYQEIGIAVEDGILNGEKTTLVVQLFGTPTGAIAQKPEVGGDGARTIADSSIATNIPSSEVQPISQEVNSINTESPPSESFISTFMTINPYAITRTVSIFLIALLTLLGIIDLFVLWRRKALANLHIRHFPHVSVISAAVIILFLFQAGSIL